MSDALSSSAPIVEILLASYNGGPYIEDLVASLQLQSFSNFRLLVSDDCSKDGTLQTLERLATIDDRISIVSKGVKHDGAKGNFMSLLAATRAPYIMFCDQDDVWLPEKISVTLERMQDLEEDLGRDKPLLVFSDMAVVDAGLGLISSSFERYSGLSPLRRNLSQLLEQNIAAGCSMMLNRTLVNLCCVDDYTAIRMHDWWAMLLASAFGEISFIDEPLLLYRQHDSNNIGADEYLPMKVHGNSSARIAGMSAHILQAAYFYELYGNQLTEGEMHRVAAYVALRDDVSYLRGVGHFIMSKSWKLGLRRKIGQLMGVLSMVRINAGKTKA